jgi:ribulose-5-phosphate 4-epimerase/fuculose-1-phosphate aldolase
MRMVVRSTPASVAVRKSVAERDVRVNLAAMYRLFDHFGWTDLTYTHLSARVPGEPRQYLINAYGLLFDEIDASNLVTVDFEGHTVNGTRNYNRAGHLIHTAILQARPEINYVLHSHTRAGAAVASMRCGLLPISQPALVVRSTLAIHPYGVAEEDADECRRLVVDLGDKYVMLMQNHGLLVCGRTAGEAFLYHYFLQTACEIQLDALRAGSECVTPGEEAAATIAAWAAPRARPWGDKQWAAMLRLLARKDPSFRTGPRRTRHAVRA